MDDGVMSATRHYPAKDGELRLKEWVYERARVEQATPLAVYSRFWRGQYNQLQVRRVNQRVVFVKEVE